MITLNAWFRKNAMRPLILLGSIAFGVQVFFIYHYVATGEIEREVRIASLVNKIANTAIEQKNRDIIEATFQVAVEELGAKYVLLCKSDSVLISYPYSSGGCKGSIAPNWFERQIEMKASGYSDYRFIFLLPRWNLSSAFAAIMLLTICSTFVCFLIIFRVQKKIRADILTPLERYVFSTSSMEIVELEKLKATINRIHESDRDAAILKARNESEAKFVHNIQSPLGNIKILKERLKPLLDPESAKLFDNVVSEISELTMSYASRSKNTRDDLINPKGNGRALIELTPIIEDCVAAKELELSSRTRKPNLLFTKDAQGKVFVEALHVELRSILSNVLNNAIDSGATNIELLLQADGPEVVLVVKDNGSGVESSIENNLFEQDVTFGKQTGTGFGLYHARTFLSQWNGSIALHETSSGGSTFAIRLPIKQFPVIKISPHNHIVILEDKKHERRRLREKLLSAVPDLSPNRIIEFDRTARALEWFENTQISMSEVVLFADNDLGDAEMTGFEMINNLGIADISYLVTNNHGSPKIVAGCRKIGLRLIPKSYIAEVEIQTFV